MDGAQPKRPRKGKQVRLLLDARTELTNEELEVHSQPVMSCLSTDIFIPQRARANYIEVQAQIRRELEQKKAEKESGRLVEEMIWGAPRGGKLTAETTFWWRH